MDSWRQTFHLRRAKMQQKVAVTSPPEGAIWVTFPKWGGWWIDTAALGHGTLYVLFSLTCCINRIMSYCYFFLVPPANSCTNVYFFLENVFFLSMSLNCSWGDYDSRIYEIDSYLCQAGLQFSPTALISLCNKQNNECRVFLLVC